MNTQANSTVNKEEQLKQTTSVNTGELLFTNNLYNLWCQESIKYRRLMLFLNLTMPSKRKGILEGCYIPAPARKRFLVWSFSHRLAKNVGALSLFELNPCYNRIGRTINTWLQALDIQRKGFFEQIYTRQHLDLARLSGAAA